MDSSAVTPASIPRVGPGTHAIGDDPGIVGDLPGRALRLAAEWADLHRDELAADRERVLVLHGGLRTGISARPR
jgi:hypothetical protein